VIVPYRGYKRSITETSPHVDSAIFFAFAGVRVLFPRRNRDKVAGEMPYLTPQGVGFSLCFLKYFDSLFSILPIIEDNPLNVKDKIFLKIMLDKRFHL